MALRWWAPESWGKLTGMADFFTPELASPLRWLHLTRPADSPQYSAFFAQIEEHYEDIVHHIGSLDALILAGGLTSGPDEATEVKRILYWQSCGLGPVVHLLPNPGDRRRLGLRRGIAPLSRSRVWCRALRSTPSSAREAGLLGLPLGHDGELLQRIADASHGELGEQTEGFRAFLMVTRQGPHPLMTSAPPLPVLGCISAHQEDPADGLREGLTAIVRKVAPSPHWEPVDDQIWLAGGQMMHAPRSSLCELDRDGTLRVWPLASFRRVTRKQAAVGRVLLPITRSLSTPLERIAIQALLNRYFPSESDLRRFLVAQFPALSKPLSRLNGREQQIKRLLAAVPATRVHRAIVDGKEEEDLVTRLRRLTQASSAGHRSDE